MVHRPTPDSALTRAAETLARRRLSPVLLNHPYRTYTFGAALGELADLDVDGSCCTRRRCCTTSGS